MFNAFKYFKKENEKLYYFCIALCVCLCIFRQTLIIEIAGLDLIFRFYARLSNGRVIHV